MNPRKKHFLFPIFFCQIFPVYFFLFQIPVKGRNGNIRFPLHVGRIGKRPQKLFASIQRQQSSYCFFLQSLKLFPCSIYTITRICNQFGLILAKIPFHMGIIGKWVWCMGKKSLFGNSQTFFFKTEFSFQHMFFYRWIRKIQTHTNHFSSIRGRIKSASVTLST